MKVLLITAILVVAFASALTLYFLLNTPKTNAVMTLTGNEIATQSASFLDGLRTGNHYFFSKSCVQNASYNGCLIYDFSVNASNAWPLYAYTALYKNTGNAAYLQKAQNEMGIISNDCTADTNSCLWILVQMIYYQQTTGDKQYSGLISNLGSRLLTTSETNDTMLLGIESRELAMLYEMNGQKEYLDQSVLRMQESKSLWSITGADSSESLLYTENGLQFYSYACWTELAEIELYKATNSSAYLQNTENFFNSANIDKHSRMIEFLVALQPCVDSLQQLSSLTGTQSFSAQAVNASQYIITYRWDPNLQIAKKYNGDSGFVSDVYGYQNNKFLNDASYMIYLLTQMKNNQFQILEWN